MSERTRTTSRSVRRAPSPVGRWGWQRAGGTTHGRGRPCHGLAALLLLLTASLACAQVELRSAEPLLVDVGGQRVIDGWYVDPEVGAVETWQVEAERWPQAHHRWATGEGSKLRQEVAARPDRLEITHLRYLESNVTGVTSAGVRLPLDVLDGARFECIGTPRGDAEREGATWTGALGPEHVTVIKDLQYLRVDLPGGAVDFDCNPKGAWCPGVGICPGTARFTLIRYDDGWRLWAADGKARRGTIHDFKLVVTPASDLAVAEVHPAVNTRWTQPYTATSRINIGTLDVKRFDAYVQPGGTLTRDERFAELRPERVEGASITADELTLTIPVERDGIYLVSLLAGDPTRQIGPCGLSAGVGEPLEAASVPAGGYACWVTPGRAVGGTIEVSVTGDARICAAQAAPMMFANEDYLLDRGWWVSTDFHADDNLPL